MTTLNLCLPAEEEYPFLTAIAKEPCEMCGGHGYTYIAAHQSGGEIVDDRQMKCLCQFNEQDDYDPE